MCLLGCAGLDVALNTYVSLELMYVKYGYFMTHTLHTTSFTLSYMYVSKLAMSSDGCK